jgi:D-lactate dehydrogenase (cytochrome)
MLVRLLCDGFVLFLEGIVLAVFRRSGMIFAMNSKISPFSPEFDEYLRDESRRSGSAEQIILAKSENDVRLALQSGLPVTIQGARTGIAAGAVPDGGLILNLSRMNSIGEIEGDRITVQPGALLSEVREKVDEAGLFFPPDPTETSASLGGMMACNASGAMSYHYGPTRSWIQSLRVMLPDGDTLRIERGQKAAGLNFSLTTESDREISGTLPELNMPNVKSAAGYYIQPNMDLLDLFIGMEGTLGVITEAELKLIPRPEFQQALCAFFPTEESALQFVRFLRENLKPVAIEFFGHNVLELLRNADMDLPNIPEHFHTAIYFEFHHDAEEDILTAAEQMMELGAGEDDCWIADTPREIEVHKTFRHATPEAVNTIIDQCKKEHPGLTKLGTDMSVPDDCLEKVMQMYRTDLATAGLEHVIFGHIGNNHVHVNILPRSMDELAQGKELYLNWAEKVVAWGGSVSAEHGIGKLKVPMLGKMYGPDRIAAMRAVKNIFDPDGILNQGNLFAEKTK